ncbi:MAG: hypothetical protein HY275_05575 [Gemmatimonadetes bacterium]|nr:hypothetical protein [Gemmatimonadota bacterium]
MSKHLHFVRGGGDDDPLTRALRAAYAAPESPAYWDGLEGRILRTLREAEGSAYLDLLPWMRWTVAAAAMLAMAAGVLEWRAREASERMAYRNVLNSSQCAT